MGGCMEERIVLLIHEIETKQKNWEENRLYDGCYAEDVHGMIKALNIITDKEWRFENNKLKAKDN